VCVCVDTWRLRLLVSPISVLSTTLLCVQFFSYSAVHLSLSLEYTTSHCFTARCFLLPHNDSLLSLSCSSNTFPASAVFTRQIRTQAEDKIHIVAPLRKGLSPHPFHVHLPPRLPPTETVSQVPCT
jgi:hypothetical protein